MKKALILCMTFALLLNCGLVVSADDVLDDPIGDEIISEYIYTHHCTNSLSISNSTANCSSNVMGMTGTATKIVVTNNLQKMDGIIWYDYDSHTKTFYSNIALYSTSKSNLSSGTYRLKTVAKVYCGNDYEIVTTYSNYVYC